MTMCFRSGLVAGGGGFVAFAPGVGSFGGRIASAGRRGRPAGAGEWLSSGAVWGERRGAGDGSAAHRHPSELVVSRSVLDTGSRSGGLARATWPMGEEGVFALALAERGFSLYYPARVGAFGAGLLFDLGVLKAG